MDEMIVPYTLPNPEQHSFFFLHQCLDPHYEAKLHQHDAWELYVVLKGHGNRMAGDSLLPFKENDVVMIPPKMHHRWIYEGDEEASYLMIAFQNSWLEKVVNDFPEIRQQIPEVPILDNAIQFGDDSAREIRRTMHKMDEESELDQLAEFIKLLPLIYNTKDYTIAGRPIQVERDVKRLQDTSAWVMKNYVSDISLDDIASHLGMNTSAFCSWFKKHKGQTFMQYVMDYRLKTACRMLVSGNEQVKAIANATGFSDLSHFVHAFTRIIGMSPNKYRHQQRENMDHSSDDK